MYEHDAGEHRSRRERDGQRRQLQRLPEPTLELLLIDGRWSDDRLCCQGDYIANLSLQEYAVKRSDPHLRRVPTLSLHWIYSCQCVRTCIGIVYTWNGLWQMDLPNCWRLAVQWQVRVPMDEWVWFGFWGERGGRWSFLGHFVYIEWRATLCCGALLEIRLTANYGNNNFIVSPKFQFGIKKSLIKNLKSNHGNGSHLYFFLFLKR